MSEFGLTVFCGNPDYSVRLYTLGSNFDHAGAVYVVFSEKSLTGSSDYIPCDPICIGETEDLCDTIAGVTDWDCLKVYGADSIAVIWEENEDRRRVIVGDLLEYYSEAPCDPF